MRCTVIIMIHVIKIFVFFLIAYRSQSPACPSPVFGRSAAPVGLLRPLSWPAGKPPKSPGDPADTDEGLATRRQLSDPISKQQFQSLATDVNNSG